MSVKLNEIDIRILDLLQENGRITIKKYLKYWVYQQHQYLKG